jgi:hypothetical protein
MPITHQPGTGLAFQQQFRPIGRIRTGQQVEFTKGGRKGKRPARLETFRLTSADHRMLERAAAVYGGTVEEWPEAPDGDALQLVTEARELDVLVPGGQPLSQWYEMWGTGGCLRRCTGDEETLSGGPCLCPSDPADRTELAAKGDACKPTTRLNLLLPDMDVGSWLLVSHSFYAAVELPPVVSLLANMATQIGKPVPAKLWIDQRRIKRPNQPPKDFSVPALRTAVTWAGLLAAGDGIAQPAIGPGDNGRVAATLPIGDTPLPDDPGADDDRDDFDEGTFSEAPAPSATKTAASASLTVDAFRGLRTRHNVTLEETLDAGRSMFPAGTGLNDLDDADRGRLWVAIQERRATAAST